MHNAIATGIFLAWFTARAAFVSVAYLMARGKGRNPLGWTLAAACGGLMAVVALSLLKEASPQTAARSGMQPFLHSFRTATAQSRPDLTA